MSTMNRRAILAGTAAAAIAVIPNPVLACDKQPSNRDRFLALVAEPDGELYALGAFMKLDLPEYYEAMRVSHRLHKRTIRASPQRRSRSRFQGA